MKLTTDQLEQARKLDHPAVKSLLEFYDFVTSNSAYDSYVTRKNYQDRWNRELIEKEVDLINTLQLKGKQNETVVMLHDKAVDRAMKYFEGQLEFLKDTEAIRAMLTPEELEQVKVDRSKIRNIAI